MTPLACGHPPKPVTKVLAIHYSRALDTSPPLLVQRGPWAGTLGSSVTWVVPLSWGIEPCLTSVSVSASVKWGRVHPGAPTLGEQGCPVVPATP